MRPLMLRPALIALAALWAVAAPAQQRCADPPGAQEKLPPFTRIIKAAQAVVGGGQLIGAEFDRCEKIYQVKLIKDGVVTIVYVDARNEQVVGIEGG